MGAVAPIGDVADGGALRAAMAGADVVYHVAGVYAVGIKAADRAPMFRANVDGTRAVIDAATAAGVPRILSVSTVGVFGVGPDLKETIRASDGVTYWASCDKARRELGYAPRALAEGLQALLAAD